MKRFFYCTSDRSKTLHRLFGPRSEGALLACGRRVTIRWHWTTRAIRGKNRKSICEQCQKAAH